MQRETKTFITPGGRTVVVKTYLTGRESNAVKDEMFKKMTVDMNAKDKDSAFKGDLSASFMLEQEKKLLGFLVESISGYEGKEIADFILDLPNDEYRSIVDELNKINAGNFSQAK